MGRTPCCSRQGLNRGAWTAMEDQILSAYIKAHGEGKWRTLPKRADLKRCGKSCRLRWLNYLKPGIKRGNISPDEDDLIIKLHKLLGNRWSLISGRLPGRTDNEIKNYWNTTLSKKIEVAAHPVPEKSSTRKSKPRNPVSAETKVNKALVSPVPLAAIRTKAHRFTSKILPSGDSILKSPTQKLNQENGYKVDISLHGVDDNDLDLIEFNSSGCFDFCENHEANDDVLALMSSKNQLPVDDQTTSQWTPSDLFADGNGMIDLGAWNWFLENEEEWLYEING